MAKYITRIELFNADEKDYQKLNAEMAKESFTPVKNLWNSSNTFALKATEYNRQGNVTLQDVTNAAYNAAKRTGKEYSFTIIKDRTFPSQYP